MSEEDSGLLVPNQLVGNDQPIEGVIHCGMSVGDPKSVEFPEAEVPPEERARRLKIEVERLASLPTVERLFYIECEGVAEKHGVTRPVLKKMVDSTVEANEKRANEDKAENRRSEQRAERKQERDGRLSRQEQERARKEAERALA